jgi:hypothetical protein
MAREGIRFDPADLPRDRFFLAGRAWLAGRRDTEAAQSFGLDPATTGASYVRGQLLRDLAALNRAEVGPWDAWGLGAPEHRPSAADLALLDAVAEVSADAGDGTAATELWRSHPELRPPDAFLRDP